MGHIDSRCCQKLAAGLKGYMWHAVGNYSSGGGLLAGLLAGPRPVPASTNLYATR
jgi:hypothetical protein